MNTNTERASETEKISTNYTIYKSNDIVKEILDGSKDISGINTHINGLEQAFDKLRPGEVSILLGRSSTGKSILIKNIIRNICCNDDVKVGMLCFEHSPYAIMNDIISIHGNPYIVSKHRHECGYDSPFDTDGTYLDPILDEVSKFIIFFVELCERGFSQYLETATQLRQEHGIDLLIIDHIRYACSSKQTGEECNLAAMMQNFKNLARRLNIPILVSLQLPGNASDKFAGIDDKINADMSILETMRHYTDKSIITAPVSLSTWESNDNGYCYVEMQTGSEINSIVLSYSPKEMRFANSCEEGILERREQREYAKEWKRDQLKKEELGIHLMDKHAGQRIQFKELQKIMPYDAKQYLERALLHLEKEKKVNIASEKNRIANRVCSTYYITFL